MIIPIVLLWYAFFKFLSTNSIYDSTCALSSNFSFLTDGEISEGIKKFEETYKEQDMIQKIKKNTFVIARKD